MFHLCHPSLELWNVDGTWYISDCHQRNDHAIVVRCSVRSSQFYSQTGSCPLWLDQKRLSWEREAMISLLGKMGHQAFLGQSEELKHSTIKSWLLFMYLRPDLILNTNLSDIVRKKPLSLGGLKSYL
ncbi:hypothetical protein KEM48_012887 [Puccinia striiformis f. sp. tritici PST-130]|nr:hypothetical protein KEM48_012887 [Puccinia striiformis f. sp. tritici PST-130]